MTDDAAPRSGWRSFVFAVVLAVGATAIVLLARGSADAAPAVVNQPGSTIAGSTPGTAGPVIPGATGQSAPTPELLAAGQQLYLTSCVSCHGVGGVGTADGPSLLGSGEASADFYLRTGRMPLAAPVPQPPSKPVAYSDEQIKALVAYVGSLCDRTTSPCTPIPDVDPDAATLEEGSALFLANCAPCHNSVAIGGALSYGNHAPSLQNTDSVQVAEAIRTGPGQMPEFGNDVLSDEQVNAIVKYVEYLHQPDHPGGLPLGYTGPVAEGFVALLVGLGALILGIRWITRESEAPPRAPTGRPTGGSGEPGGPTRTAVDEDGIADGTTSARSTGDGSTGDGSASDAVDGSAEPVAT